MKENLIDIHKQIGFKKDVNLKISRKSFLKGMGALAGAGLLTLAGIDQVERIVNTDPTFHTEFDKNNESLSYDEAERMALSFHSIREHLPEETKKVPVSYGEMVRWALEVLPQFEYEGAVDRAVIPTNLGFQAFLDATSHNHVAGRSNCSAFVTNLRFENPNSSWYGRPSWIPTVIHEMVHVQQGNLCQTSDRENIENTAQIVTWEVMAGLINGGNKLVDYSLVDELRGVALSAAWGIALKEKQPEKFDSLRKRTSEGADEYARYEKAKRFWAENMESLQWILETYNEVPLNKVVKAIRQDRNVIKGLALPRVQAWSGMWLVPGWARDFKVDDLAYFIKNARAIIKDSFNDREGNT